MGYKLTNPELTDLPSSKLDAVMDIVEELTAWWPKIPLKKKLCSCMPPSAIWPMPCWRGPTRMPACRRPICWRCCGRCKDVWCSVCFCKVGVGAVCYYSYEMSTEKHMFVLNLYQNCLLLSCQIIS